MGLDVTRKRAAGEGREAQNIMASYHFIGIGGVGMSGIAQLLLQMGHRVSGSDVRESEITLRLERMGARIFIGHRPDNLPMVDEVVVSSAIPPENVELQEARRRGIPIRHRGDMLARLMQEQQGIAIAGCHGKTTTTSLIALILEHAGMDPSVLIGGELHDIGGNAKMGQGTYLVAETDESDGSFLKLRPRWAVITNIDRDHLDHYGGNFGRLKEAFAKFASLVHPDGGLVACFDDPHVREAARGARCRVVSYALDHPGAKYGADELRLGADSSSFLMLRGDRPLGRVNLSVTGRHNVQNALASAALAYELGVDLDSIRRALRQFRGARRRFERQGQVQGVTVIDDYAHHPTEVVATIRAARLLKPRKLICLFQPHRYTRTQLLGPELGQALAEADLAVVVPIYAAGERPLEGVDARRVVEGARARGGRARYCAGIDEAVSLVVEEVEPGDVVITMGAGDVWQAAPRILRALERRYLEGDRCRFRASS